jgi:hypothetical protein
MCDYSLHAAKTRPARVDDKVTIRMFGWSTRGFAATEDKNVAFAYRQELNCPLLKRLGKYIPGHGPRQPVPIANQQHPLLPNIPERFRAHRGIAHMFVMLT